MTYRIGTIHQNNIFVRCPHCGDSEHRSYVGHLSINIVTGMYRCFRCGAQGRLSTREHFLLYSDYSSAVALAQQDFDLDTVPVGLPPLEDDRHTLVPHSYVEPYRVYAMRSPTGRVVGYHYRHIHSKWHKNKGSLGYGYSGDYLGHSDIRLVEGVYDVVYPNDVAVFGGITMSKVLPLVPYTITLAPDGDIIAEDGKRESFIRSVKGLMRRGFAVQGIEVFGEGIDPHLSYTQNLPRIILTPSQFLATYERGS